MINLNYEYVCAECKKEDKCSQPNQKLCSETCRENYYGRHKVLVLNEQLSSGTVGAIAELKVSVKLMKEGYAVFRALSPACFCDLIAIKDNEKLYVEVRTGYLSATGNLGFPKKISTRGGRPTHFAVYTAKDDKINIIKI